MPRDKRPATLHSVFERTFHEQRRALVGWTASLVILALIMVAMYPTIRGNKQLVTLHETYPKALRSLFGISDLASGTGFLRAELFSLIAPLLLIILAVLWGSDVIAGEEDRGTIDILMANPISRRRVVLEKWAALLVGVAIAGVGLGVGLAIGIPAVDMHVGWQAVAAAVVASIVLGILFGTIALAIGAATGRRGLARGLTAALVAVAYLVSSLSDLVTWLGPLRPASPWYHALGTDPLTTGFQGWRLLLLLVVTGLLVYGAVGAFQRRDLAV
jgi:beta-exotoxin I transport system permease protein